MALSTLDALVEVVLTAFFPLVAPREVFVFLGFFALRLGNLTMISFQDLFLLP